MVRTTTDRTRRASRGAVVTACALVGGVIAVTVAPSAVAASPTVREQSWYLDAMHVEAAQKISTGKGVTVAVVDSGVNPDVPELRGRVLSGYDAGGGNGQTDEVGHGTEMASLIAGGGGDADHVLGMAPDAKILPVQLSHNADPGNLSHFVTIKAVHWAIDHGARVVSMSFSGEDVQPTASWKDDLVRYAMKHNAVLVASSGNKPNGETEMGVPADIPGVVAVTGLGEDGKAWSGSVTGSAAVVSAPAEDVMAAGIDPPHETHTGTSGSAALVSGELALIMSKYPHISATDAINRLIRTADDRGTEGRDPTYGFGAADPLKALTASVPHVDRNPLLAGGTGKQADDAGASTGIGHMLLIGVVVAGVLVLLALVAVLVLVLRSRRHRGPGGRGGPGGPGGPAPTTPAPGFPVQQGWPQQPGPQQTAPSLGGPPPAPPGSAHR